VSCQIQATSLYQVQCLFTSIYGHQLHIHSLTANRNIIFLTHWCKQMVSNVRFYVHLEICKYARIMFKSNAKSSQFSSSLIAWYSLLQTFCRGILKSGHRRDISNYNYSHECCKTHQTVHCKWWKSHWRHCIFQLNQMLLINIISGKLPLFPICPDLRDTLHACALVIIVTLANRLVFLLFNSVVKAFSL
jgi:hypothetical protein